MIPDREKVIRGLECCGDKNKLHCDQCPYDYNGRGNERYECTAELSADALVLLKEQEAKPMTEYDDGWDCPRCGLKLVGKTASGYPCDKLNLPDDEIVKYCPVCGQAVKWSDL